MERGLTAERIRAAAEGSGQPAVCRPDRRRRRGERFLLLDILAHISQTAFQTLQERAQYTEGVFGRRKRGGEDVGDRGVGLRRAAGSVGVKHRREFRYGASLSRIERRARAELVDHVFERLNL